ncbi:hypothetical protein [Roseomonas xinghualingensis]|uniref:hypothetical protein n=1 Tax=Roseomonas xinghualingensis TaxID=2986475 RepID=UPI0021F22D8C|nr:hypothetical protein [Roseomonas sp. SXEYE001]
MQDALSIPTPHMSDAEFRLFESVLRCAHSYVEFGTGGSTCLAASLVGGSIISVDSSLEWLDQVAKACASRPGWTQPRLIHADIGPVGEWGRPADPATQDLWPRYHEAPWSIPGTETADLYMVDGRFRVACALQVLLRCRWDALLVMHDFSSRRGYHVVRELAREVAIAEDLSVFQRRPDFDLQKAHAILARHAYDPG